LAGDRLVGQPPEVLQEAVSRSLEAQRRLDDEAVGDVVLDTTSVEVSELADEILPPARLAARRLPTQSA
jgi:hypothetical protein